MTNRIKNKRVRMWIKTKLMRKKKEVKYQEKIEMILTLKCVI